MLIFTVPVTEICPLTSFDVSQGNHEILSLMKTKVCLWWFNWQKHAKLCNLNYKLYIDSHYHIHSMYILAYSFHIRLIIFIPYTSYHIHSICISLCRSHHYINSYFRPKRPNAGVQIHIFLLPETKILRCKKCLIMIWILLLTLF